MAKKTYAEQLKHPNWQRKRLEVLQAADFACASCGDKESTLHVHHKRYVKGREVWEYELNELQCLCETCHADHHETHALLEQVLSCAEVWEPAAGALGLTAGYYGASESIPADLARRARLKARPIVFDLGVIAYALAVSPAEMVRQVVQLLVSQDGLPGEEARGAFDKWKQIIESGEGE